LTQSNLEPILLSMLKPIQLELTKLLPLKLERTSTKTDILNQKRFSSLIQRLLELILHSTLKISFKKMKPNQLRELINK